MVYLFKECIKYTKIIKGKYDHRMMKILTHTSIAIIKHIRCQYFTHTYVFTTISSYKQSAKIISQANFKCAAEDLVNTIRTEFAVLFDV